MKIRTSYTGNETITAGKIYAAMPIADGMVRILDNNGLGMSVRVDGGKSVHLDGIGKWEIVPQTYADVMTEAADQLAEVLTILRGASAESTHTAIQRASVRPLIEPMATLHARLYELACAAQDTPR